MIVNQTPREQVDALSAQPFAKDTDERIKVVGLVKQRRARIAAIQDVINGICGDLVRCGACGGNNHSSRRRQKSDVPFFRPPFFRPSYCSAKAFLVVCRRSAREAKAVPTKLRSKTKGRKSVQITSNAIVQPTVQ